MQLLICLKGVDSAKTVCQSHYKPNIHYPSGHSTIKLKGAKTKFVSCIGTTRESTIGVDKTNIISLSKPSEGKDTCRWGLQSSNRRQLIHHPWQIISLGLIHDSCPAPLIHGDDPCLSLHPGWSIAYLWPLPLWNNNMFYYGIHNVPWYFLPWYTMFFTMVLFTMVYHQTTVKSTIIFFNWSTFFVRSG